jgi:hypothetical protein
MLMILLLLILILLLFNFWWIEPGIISDLWMISMDDK